MDAPDAAAAGSQRHDNGVVELHPGPHRVQWRVAGIALGTRSEATDHRHVARRGDVADRRVHTEGVRRLDSLSIAIGQAVVDARELDQVIRPALVLVARERSAPAGESPPTP